MYVDDIDGHCERARAADAEIIAEPTSKHDGDRNYEALDREGHSRSFGERVDQDAWEKAAKEREQSLGGANGDVVLANIRADGDDAPVAADSNVGRGRRDRSWTPEVGRRAA